MYHYFDEVLSATDTAWHDIEQFSTPGEWTLDYMLIYDELENNRTYHTAELHQMGIDTSIVVINGLNNQNVWHVSTAGSDTTAVSYTHLTLPTKRIV